MIRRLVYLALLVALPAHAATNLSRTIRTAAASVGGKVGVAIVHLPSRRSFYLNADERYPMMSVFKLPIAIAALRLADAGKFDLAQKVSIRESDLRNGVSPLRERFRSAPFDVTALELLELMVRNSDNTACDRLLGMIGGPKVVQAHLRQLGVSGIDVSQSEGEMAKRFHDGLPRQAAIAFMNDRRNTAQPRAFVKLLGIVERGDGLAPASHARLMKLLRETVPAAKRIKGLLPAGTEVAHRPGTSGSAAGGVTPATNDTGIITLPNGRGVVLIAVFVKGSARPLDQREQAIAKIARAAYDAFSATP